MRRCVCEVTRAEPDGWGLQKRLALCHACHQRAPWGSWRGRVQLTLTRIYGWGRGEGSGRHSATTRSRPLKSQSTQLCPWSLQAPRCLRGFTPEEREPPPGGILCVSLRLNQIRGSCYFLITWKEKSFDSFCSLNKVHHSLMSPKPERSACLKCSMFEDVFFGKVWACKELFLESFPQQGGSRDCGYKTLLQLLQLWYNIHM